MSIENIPRMTIQMLRKRSGLVLFLDAYNDRRSVLFDGGVVSFDERPEDGVIEMQFDQLRIPFFLGSEEGIEIKALLDGLDFDSDDSFYLANRMSYARLEKLLR